MALNADQFATFALQCVRRLALLRRYRQPPGKPAGIRAALEQLARFWYATGMERVREVRGALVPWQGEECVRALDDRLYDWGAIVSALQR